MKEMDKKILKECRQQPRIVWKKLYYSHEHAIYKVDSYTQFEMSSSMTEENHCYKNRLKCKTPEVGYSVVTTTTKNRRKQNCNFEYFFEILNKMNNKFGVINCQHFSGHDIMNNGVCQHRLHEFHEFHEFSRII
jgi:hypothetical protein